MFLRRSTRQRIKAEEEKLRACSEKLNKLKEEVGQEEKRIDEALKLNMKLHESGMETVANLEKALDEHCKTVCNADAQRAKDSALRKAVEKEQEELRRRIEAMKEEYSIYDTGKLPPLKSLLKGPEPEGECA